MSPHDPYSPRRPSDLLTGAFLFLATAAFLLAAPLIFLGTGSIFPHPFYDSDCTLFILSCTWLLLRLESANFPPLSTFAGGILIAAPLFIKQNTGLAFLLTAVVCIAYLGIRSFLATRNASPESRRQRTRPATLLRRALGPAQRLRPRRSAPPPLAHSAPRIVRRSPYQS